MNPTVSCISDFNHNFTFGRTAGALLARITALDTGRLVNGETRTSFKWSTSPTYTGGQKHKENAILSLIEIMKNEEKDLKALQNAFACDLCQIIELQLNHQVV